MTAPALPPLPALREITAPPAWGVVDFFSDLHLSAQAPQTLATLSAYLRSTPAHALFILGDLFEVWIGDDVLQNPRGFEAQCCAALAQASAAGKAVFFLPGNRDFLIGAGFAQASAATVLTDPAVLNFAARRWLLTHGDALCIDDHDYQRFRALARSGAWQQQFLAQSCDERQAQARAIRAQSQARQQPLAQYADVDGPAALAWLQAAQAQTLIHGHTHRPARHDIAPGHVRHVLSDWDGSGPEVLRLSASGHLQRIALTGPP